MSGRMKRNLKRRVQANVTRRDELARFLAGKAKGALMRPRSARQIEAARGR